MVGCCLYDIKCWLRKGNSGVACRCECCLVELVTWCRLIHHLLIGLFPLPLASYTWCPSLHGHWYCHSVKCVEDRLELFDGHFHCNHCSIYDENGFCSHSTKMHW